MEWYIQEALPGECLGVILASPVDALLLVPDAGKVFAHCEGMRQFYNADWGEISIYNAQLDRPSTIISRLAALVKYGVTDEFVKKLCNKPS